MIPDFICSILGLKFVTFLSYRRMTEIREWESNFPLQSEIPSESSLSEFEKCLAQASKVKSKPISNASKSSSCEIRKIPLDLSLCSTTPFGLELKDEIEASYQAHVEDSHRNSQINTEKYLNPSTLIETQQVLIRAKKKLKDLLFKCNEVNRLHIDVVTGFRAETSVFDFVDILL